MRPQSIRLMLENEKIGNFQHSLSVDQDQTNYLFIHESIKVTVPVYVI